MVQRDTGRLSQSAVDELQRQKDIATVRTLGSNLQSNMRSLPGNVISSRELPNVQAEAVVVGEQYLVFSLLECELALKAEHIDGVERLADVTPVPNVASWLRHWAGTPLPGLLADKLERGGCIVFASAAALTLGLATVPVYEIYKVGEEPRWLEGLDLMAAAGLRVAVIPHYNNAEGGNHDTRYCYLGERRLRIMEELLPDDAFVLGVDEHTACVMDLEAGTASVAGLGVVTVRRHGSSTTLDAGTTVPMGALIEMAMEGNKAHAPTAAAGVPVTGNADMPGGSGGDDPLLDTIRRQEEAFDAALAAGELDAAVRAVLELDEALVAWSADTLQSDHMDQGRAVLRRMIVRLGSVAEAGARDPRSAIEPYVTALLEERGAAREGRRFADADRIRDRLVALGLEIRDTPEGTAWELPRPS